MEWQSARCRHGQQQMRDAYPETKNLYLSLSSRLNGRNRLEIMCVNLSLVLPSWQVHGQNFIDIARRRKGS